MYEDDTENSENEFPCEDQKQRPVLQLTKLGKMPISEQLLPLSQPLFSCDLNPQLANNQFTPNQEELISYYVNLINNNLIQPNTLKKPKYSRLSIPKIIKEEVWLKTYGDKVLVICTVCNHNRISAFNHECGHIISIAHGGNNDVSNLKSICRPCNSSMGMQNMNDFQNMWFSNQINVGKYIDEKAKNYKK